MDEFDELLGIPALVVDMEEAELIDWVLTMHSWSQEQLDWLMNTEIQKLRIQAGQVIIDHGGKMIVDETTCRLLLAMIPITFHFGERDVGNSLKQKLFRLLIKPREVPDADKDKARCESKAEDSTDAGTEPLPSG